MNTLFRICSGLFFSTLLITNVYAEKVEKDTATSVETFEQYREKKLTKNFNFVTNNYTFYRVNIENNKNNFLDVKDIEKKINETNDIKATIESLGTLYSFDTAVIKTFGCKFYEDYVSTKESLSITLQSRCFNDKDIGLMLNYEIKDVSKGVFNIITNSNEKNIYHIVSMNSFYGQGIALPGKNKEKTTFLILKIN